MSDNEFMHVLTNWITRALSPPGDLPEGTDPAAWVASRFSEWWSERAGEALGDAELATESIREELKRLGGGDRFGEAFHELHHLENALTELRALLGMNET